MTITANLRDHTALITGAGGLLGLEHAKALVSANCNVIITDISEESLKLTRAKLIKYKPKLLLLLFYY